MTLDQTNTRRFRHIDGVAVLAIFDTNRSFTLYGEVIAINGQPAIDTNTIRSFFPDELEELR